MHSGLNSVRDHLFNWLKDIWSWNQCNASNHAPLLFPLLPEHNPPHITVCYLHHLCFTSVKRNIALNSFSCTFYSMQIFLNLTANIMILGRPWLKLNNKNNFKHKTGQASKKHLMSTNVILLLHLPEPPCPPPPYLPPPSPQQHIL